MILIIIYGIIITVNEKEILSMEKRCSLNEVNLRIEKLMVHEMTNMKLINKWLRIKKKLYPDAE